jgi:hypothetical protein
MLNLPSRQSNAKNPANQVVAPPGNEGYDMSEHDGAAKYCDYA